MHCTKCGSELPAGSAFCANCGSRVEPPVEAPQTPPAAPQGGFTPNAAPAQPQAPAAPQGGYAPNAASQGFTPNPAPAYAAAGYTPAPAAAAKKPNKNIFIIIGAAIAAILVILLLCKFVIFNSPTTVAKNYLKAYLNGDYIKSYKYTYGPTFNESLGIQAALSDTSKSDLKKEVTDAQKDKKDSLKDTYGSNYKIKIGKIEKEKVDKDQIKEYISYWNESLDSRLDNDKLSSAQKRIIKKYKVKDSQVSAAYILTVHYTIKGSKDSYEGERTLYVAKVKGLWKVIN